jgi:hypothetical protein
LKSPEAADAVPPPTVPENPKVMSKMIPNTRPAARSCMRSIDNNQPKDAAKKGQLPAPSPAAPAPHRHIHPTLPAPASPPRRPQSQNAALFPVNFPV